MYFVGEDTNVGGFHPSSQYLLKALILMVLCRIPLIYAFRKNDIMKMPATKHSLSVNPVKHLGETLSQIYIS